MLEHRISEEELADSDIEEHSIRGSRNERPSLWENALCAAVQRALNVRCYIDEDRNRRYIGYGPSAEIAAYAFHTLFRRLKIARREYIKARLRRCSLARKRLRADAFCEGWALAVFTKVRSLAPARATDDRLNTYLERRHPGLVKVGTRSVGDGDAVANRDYWNGHREGRQIDLHHGVDHGETGVRYIAA